MTALLDLRAALSDLLSSDLGTYTLANGATTPAIAVRAIGEARKTGTTVSGMELIIERDPDTIQVQTQGQSPSVYEWTIWLVSWDESSLAVPAAKLVAAFPNVEAEPIKVPEGSGPSNQIRISLQTGQALVVSGPPSGVTVTGTSSETLILLGSAAGFVGTVSIGSSSQALAITGTAAGLVSAGASATGSSSATLALTGTAAGTVRVAGASAQTLAITGSAAGGIRVAGSSAQTLAIAGTAAGIVQNVIVAENARTGVADSTVGFSTIANGTNGFYGYAKQFSRNVGETISFAVDGVNAANIAIHRIGHYNSLRWRLVETVANTGTDQPDSVELADSNGARTCAGWSTTATWSIPSDAVSGLYMAVVRDSGNVARSWIPFIVREDSRAADIVVRISDTYWCGAGNYYNTKASPLTGKHLYGQGVGADTWNNLLRAVQTSYDRPVVTRSTTASGNFWNHWDNLESSLIDWVERSGFNVKYISCYDLDQGLGCVGSAKVLANAGHDPFWSDGMVNNTEAFISAGGHHVVFSAHTQNWRIRWADGGRSFFCYRDSLNGPTALRTGGGGTQLDPVTWTGTWQDTRWVNRRPSNLLIGSTFRMNGRNETMVINAAANQTKPFWRNTTVASGTNLTVAGIIGYNGDSVDFPNSGGVTLGTTDINVDGAYADGNGAESGNGTLNWGISVFHPKPDINASGLSVNFQTNQWIWGLSDYHRLPGPGAIRNREVRQATLNLLTDLGATAETPESDLTPAVPVALSTYGATKPSTVTVAASPSTTTEDGADIVYTFTRSNGIGALAVNYTISGSAINGTDYATITSPVNFSDGQTTAQVVVNPTPDAESEITDETVILTIAAGTGYAIGSPSAATGTFSAEAPPVDSDAAAYIAAVESADGQTLEPAIASAINSFVLGCKADGTWSAIQASCILAGARTLAGALVPLRGPAPVNFNFVSGDYNRETGLLGNGTNKYLNSDRPGNSAGQDSSHQCVFVTTALTTSAVLGSYIGQQASVSPFDGAHLGRLTSNGNLYFRMNNSTSTNISGSGAATGFMGVSRGSSSSFNSRISGTTTAHSQTSVTPRNFSIFVQAINLNNAAAYWSNGRISFYSIGAGLDLALLDARTTTLMNAIAAAI